MSIVLRENEWAEQMIESRSLGKKPSETLRRVARYYLDKSYSEKETRKRLEMFLLQCDSSASITKWDAALTSAIKYAKKFPSISIDGIDISKAEMETVDSIEGKQIRRLAFTLLCLAKYHTAVYPDCDYWVNDRDSAIMSMANIRTSIRRQSAMYWTLRELGLIRFSKKIDNTNVKVCFVNGDDVALRVTDFRNLGYQYMMYHGEPFFECCNCGLVTKMDNPGIGRRQKYCKQCAIEIAVQSKVNYVMRKKSLVC